MKRRYENYFLCCCCSHTLHWGLPRIITLGLKPLWSWIRTFLQLSCPFPWWRIFIKTLDKIIKNFTLTLDSNKSSSNHLSNRYWTQSFDNESSRVLLLNILSKIGPLVKLLQRDQEIKCCTQFHPRWDWKWMTENQASSDSTSKGC